MLKDTHVEVHLVSYFLCFRLFTYAQEGEAESKALIYELRNLAVVAELIPGVVSRVCSSFATV